MAAVGIIGVVGAAATRPADAQVVRGGAGGPTDRVDVGIMVGQITRAHDEGREAATRSEWRVRVGRDERARALLDGTLARLAFRYEEAEHRYRVAASDSAGRVGAWAQLGRAAIAGSEGKFLVAMQAFAAAGTRMARLADSVGQSEALIGQTLTGLRVVGVDSARTLLRVAAGVVPRDDAVLQARLQCVMLQVRVRAGERVADSTWTRVLGVVAPHGTRLQAECLFTRAQYVESLGQADAARALFDTVGGLQMAARLWNALSATRQWQGTTLLARGRHGLARIALREALAYAQRGASVSGEAWALQELGRVSQRVGASGDALQYFTAAHRLFEVANDATGVLYAERAMADAALSRRDFTTADSLYGALVARADRLAPQLRVPVLVARSDIARRRGSPAHGTALLDSAATLAQSRNLPGWASEIRYHRGLVALAEGQPSKAIAQWDTLLRSRNLQGPSRFEVLMRWAEAQSLAGDFDRAWATVGQAKRTLDAWNRGFRQREDVLAMLQDRAFDWDGDLGIATTIARFAAAQRVPEALAMAEWRRVRGREQAALQRGALQVDVVRAAPKPIIDTSALDRYRLPALARGRLSRHTAVVSYIVGRGDEPTTAIILTSDTLLSMSLVAIDSMVAPIERFAAFLQAGREPAPLAKSLSDALIVPVINALPATVQRLVVVPDGELHRLPFAALRNPDGTPLLTRVEIAIAPSVEDALGSAAIVARRTMTRGSALLVGAPHPMPARPGDSTTWPDLPGARAEVRAVRGMLGNAAVLEGDAVTRATLARRFADGGTVLHVATHAVATPASFVSAGFVIAPTASDGDAGLFDLPALAAQPLPFDLVVLSACSSGEGVLLSGQALHGLVSTALDAGARGVVATRWRLDDTAIVPHVERFYDELLRGRDVVSALHHVRLTAMRSGVSPAIWANLEYFGDPTLQLTLERRPRTVWSRATDTVRRWLRSLRRRDQP